MKMLPDPEPRATALELDAAARDYSRAVASFLEHVSEASVQIFLAISVGEYEEARRVSRWLRDDALGADHVEDVSVATATTGASS